MTKENDSDEKLIQDAGGPAKLAKLCGVTRSAVSQWKHNGIPKAQRNFLRLACPDVFDTHPVPPARPSRRKTDAQPQ